MKKLIALTVVAGLVVFAAGCPTASTPKSGSGSGSGSGKDPVVTPSTPKGGIDIPKTKAKVDLTVEGAGDVKQGAKLPLKVKAKRGDYKGDITLAVTVVDADKNKVKIDEKDIKLAGDKDEATVTVMVDADSPEGDVTINIVGTGKDMEEAKATATKVKVVKK